MSRTGELVLTADARLDNREELIGGLGLDDRPPGEITDSQLILAAYERWGEDCPKHLVGDFAWVIWDGRQQTLFAARDHFGAKPFYYYFDQDRILVFASEIQAILAVPGVPRQLNEVMVADYLLPRFDDQTITFYQGILRLPPAHCLRYGPGGVKTWSYWSLDPSRELRCKSPQDYLEGFHHHFLEAVRPRLRSAFPVGAMLSGGLDSSAITCVARHLLASGNGPPLKTFSAIFPKVPESDEQPFINAVLAQGNLEPHYIHGDELNPLGDNAENFAHPRSTLIHSESVSPVGHLPGSSAAGSARPAGWFSWRHHCLLWPGISARTGHHRPLAEIIAGIRTKSRKSFSAILTRRG